MLAPERNASVPPSPHNLLYNCFVAILNLNSLPTLFSEIFICPPLNVFLNKIPELELDLAPDVISGAALFICPPLNVFLNKIPELELDLAPDVISGAALLARPFMVIYIPLLK